MKLSNLAYAAVGYTLGARAGRERYEAIVSLTRRFAGSQTVQSTAGVVQAQFDQLTGQTKRAVADRRSSSNGANGHRS